MARYRGPRIRITRRLGELPGLTSKETRRNFPPGQHGPNKTGRKTTSEYGLRLQEKQKLRYNYGVSEKQLFNYVKEARRLKGATGTLLLQLLEMRLDTLVFRAGFAPTIPAARQLVNHGLINVNGTRVDIPSFQCEPSDVISIKEKVGARNLVSNTFSVTSSRPLPFHLELDQKSFTAKVNNFASREDVSLNINELLIVEFYSRK